MNGYQGMVRTTDAATFNAEPVIYPLTTMFKQPCKHGITVMACISVAAKSLQPSQLGW